MSLRSAIAFVALAGTCIGCAPNDGGPVAGPATYRDPAGWEVTVPEGWRATHFSLDTAISSAQGAQISNISGLPRPAAEYGTPLQTNGTIVPGSGIAVVIATDRGPEQSSERVFTPPLRSDDLTEGSCLAGSPCLDVLWFRGAGRIFILSAKIGANAYGRQQDALASLIRSVRFVG